MKLSDLWTRWRYGVLAAGLTVGPSIAAGQEPMPGPGPAPWAGAVPGAVPGTPAWSGPAAGAARDTAGQTVWRAYHRQGWDALRAGKTELAETLFRAELKVIEGAPPGDRRMATTYNDLAWVFLLRDKPDQAEPLARWALQASEAQLGPNDPEVADTLLALARITTARKQYDESESLARRALRIYLKSKFGVEDKHPPYTLDVLGQNQEAQGNYPQAEALYLRALSLRESALGLSYETPYITEKDISSSYRRLSDLMRRMGRADEADAFDQKAEEIEVTPPPAPGEGRNGGDGGGLALPPE